MPLRSSHFGYSHVVPEMQRREAADKIAKAVCFDADDGVRWASTEST